MNWFINLSTRAKLFIGYGIVVALLIVVMVTANRGITEIERSQKHIFTSEFANVEDLLELRIAEGDVRTALLMMMSAQERSGKELFHQNIKESAEQIAKLQQRLSERNRNEPNILHRIEELNKVRLAFKQTRDTQLIPLIYEGKTEEARKLALGIQAERFEMMRSITMELVKEAEQDTHRYMIESEKNARGSIRIFMVVGAIAVLIGVFVALSSDKILAAPLTEIAALAKRVGSGELKVDVPFVNRLDEVGILAQTFRKMVENLQKQTRDITEAVNVLASSSNEIAATTAQLASGTEETAVAVSQTTATAEEVKQTTGVSSQKARHVSDIAQNAVQVAQAGTKLVGETIEGISRIMEQMEYIAETIVRLSEHNQAIGDIIATVDDLAEQSNLLAVNASIEAAKAGEHGKGFIVVAQEIKGLADQSKQATRQVRTILNDIQKSSSAAVMATEKGSKAVEAVVKQSSGTGDSIGELSRIINEASQAAMQIAASSQQALVGVDQVALAMNSIKQATSQNAASTKQVEVTVRNLQELGQRLKTLVEHYKV